MSQNSGISSGVSMVSADSQAPGFIAPPHPVGRGLPFFATIYLLLMGTTASTA